MSLSIIQSM